MKKYIYQTDTYDCGAAALSTILHHYGTSLSLSKIRDLTHTKKWNNCFRYCKRARSLNINADAYQADINSIKENDEKTFPFIAHVVKNKTLQQNLIFYKVDFLNNLFYFLE
ncbi:cysteine peptidase family C39 domain-containing protein [Aerococcus urinaeequi]|uniref:cysteine peptidase family C39 domain-containing protein n=1 Tax=Aerococcus urinaeequi TaxID=51665 RepID=UPI003AAE2270